jgi:hypothetical protein
MDEMHNQANFINFTDLTKRITELEDTKRVAQLTQTDEWEEDGELEQLTDLRDQLVRIFGAKAAETYNPVLAGEGAFPEFRSADISPGGRPVRVLTTTTWKG